MPVIFQTRTPATPPGTLVVKTTSTPQGEVQHVNVDSLIEVFPAPYHASPFGGFRVARDFLAQDNVHLYPGVSTADQETGIYRDKRCFDNWRGTGRDGQLQPARYIELERGAMMLLLLFSYFPKECYTDEELGYVDVVR